MLTRKQSLTQRNSPLTAVAAALLLTLGATGCNSRSSESAEVNYGTLPLLAPTVGQDNGSLTSSLPSPRDPHHQLHIRITSHVSNVSFRHSFHPAH